MTHLIAASDIVDESLTRTGNALMQDDFETFLAQFKLPHIVETFEGRQTVKTAEDLKTLFTSVRAFHKRQGIDRIVRSCRHAEYKTDTAIEGVYEALFFNGNTLVQSLHSTFVVLTKSKKGRWEIDYNMYGVTEENGLGDALVHAPGLSQAPAAAENHHSG